MNHLTRRTFIKSTAGGAAGLSLAAVHRPVYAENQSRHENPQPFELRFRQIHLDFHTSEHIKNIGSRFDADEFADTLKKAHVDSVTCFGRCHHGYIYHDTKKFPERRHPHLNRNLLKEQIDACHKRNIRVPIYVTVQWDHYTARRHPDWLILDEDGAPVGTDIYEPGFYRRLCSNSPYTDFLREYLEDLFEAVPVDGLFLDIVHARECSCYYCRQKMLDTGLDPSDAGDRALYATQRNDAFKKELTAFIRKMDKKCSIFYNAGHLGPYIRSSMEAYTHFELESLPSGHWGYLHFPLTVRYARNLGRDLMGMTGKFHTAWGDFHSFKTQPALEFEVFTMLAMGAKCSIGDQLHPLGKIDPVTYDLVGSVYGQVEKKEPWCTGARPVTEIGVLTPEEFISGRTPAPAMGCVRMLQEGGHQFDMLDSLGDFSGYKLLVLPDVIPVDDALAKKISTFVAGGGAVLASFKSGLDQNGEKFNLEELGLRFKGDAPYSPDFVLPKGDIGKGLRETEYVMYLKGKKVETLPGTKVLAQTLIPYFNRTWEHFCSHRHTPSSGQTGYPAITQNGRVVYFQHPVFTQYNKNAPLWVKQLFLNAVDILLPDPLVRVSGPTSMIATLNVQKAKNRRVLHLLNYIPERRGEDFDVIQDVVPVFDIRVSVKTANCEKIQLVPQQKPLEFVRKAGRCEFTVPVVSGHQMVALQAQQ